MVAIASKSGVRGANEAGKHHGYCKSCVLYVDIEESHPFGYDQKTPQFQRILVRDVAPRHAVSVVVVRQVRIRLMTVTGSFMLGCFGYVVRLRHRL